MQHTYLRYECADSFGLVSASASSKAPQSNSTLAFLGTTRNKPVVLSTAGSHVVGYHLRTSLPTIKIGHREQLSGGVGTGRALNSDQVVCVAVLQADKHDESGTCRVASGWVDGAVRIFDVTSSEISSSSGTGLVHSLLHENESSDEFTMREPLVLNGHMNSPVRSLAFCSESRVRLASGSSDGSVVLWDIVAETGLFRLLGHKGGITDIQFIKLENLDLLATSCLDGLVKIWDLKGQCCTQTIPVQSGEVWSAACQKIPPRTDEEKERCRLVVGTSDGRVRVWGLNSESPSASTSAVVSEDSKDKDESSVDHGTNQSAEIQLCRFMGILAPPANVVTSSDRIACIHYHTNGKYFGVLRNNSKVVEVYFVRGIEESNRKRQRRLKRRKEKSKVAAKKKEAGQTGQKRGLLDDPESDQEPDKNDLVHFILNETDVRASDEFEFFGNARASHKIKDFAFVPFKEARAGIRIVCSLTTNAIETVALEKSKEVQDGSYVESKSVAIVDMLGHPTGIRGIELSSDDNLACSVSKNAAKIWNVASRSCIQSVSPSIDGNSCYGLCVKFLPGNSHVVIGTREGHLLILDTASGDVVFAEEKAHEGAIWSIDVRRPNPHQETATVISGSADKSVKFWDIESQEDDDQPMLTHTRTLQASDDVIAVRYSNSLDPSKRMVFVSTLDSTIKVFFDDTLKFFLSLYGHKLPALAIDASDDDVILASSGADKTIKIWGLDFGDTHRTLHGHEDSITDLRFVRRTHNFFTTCKDGTVRYWDGDRFEQIQLLTGHAAEVSCLSISRTGAFVLSAGMDRQVRVWERTKDIVFLEEERERELEQMFDRIDDRDAGGTGRLLKKKQQEDNDADEHEEPQSEAAVKRSVMSVAAGDRIMEALERADQELKDVALHRRSSAMGEKAPNPLLLGMDSPQYILWVLKSIKQAELEQSLLFLPLGHVERLLYYLVILLRSGRGVELCSRVGVFLVKTHQKQFLGNRSIVVPLRELRKLVHDRVSESRDTIGFNLAALRMVARVAQERKDSHIDYNSSGQDIWSGMGLGSDLAAALEKGNRR